MQKISKTQGEELLRLVDELKIPEVFELLDNYGFKEDVTINILRREYIRNHYGADCYERLKACIGNITDNSLIETEYDIFFSFSSKNRAEAEPIVKLLRECELAVFFSDEHLQQLIGQGFMKGINKALKESKHFILLCTPDAMASDWVFHEYNTFYEKAYIPTRHQRRLFILENQLFSPDLITSNDLLSGIQTTKNIETIINILGKTMPTDDLAERIAEYKELLELFLENSQNINDKQRKQLVSKQKELKLSEEQVAEIEKEVINEFIKIETVNVTETITTEPNITETVANEPNVTEIVATENKTKSRNYAVIATVAFALLLGGGYSVVEWKKAQEKLNKQDLPNLKKQNKTAQKDYKTA